MLKIRGILILISPQPHYILVLILILLFESPLSHGNLIHERQSTSTITYQNTIPTNTPNTHHSPKSQKTEFRVSFNLPDDLPANHLIGNIPAQLPHFPMTRGLGLTVSATLVDTVGVAPRLLRVSDAGDLFTSVPIDRDDPNQVCGPLQCCPLIVCNLTVRILFIHAHWEPITVHVTLQLHDTNDNPPVFTKPTFSVWIPEENGLQSLKSETTSYALPQAKDPDSAPNGVVAYRLTGNYMAQTVFQLHSNLTSGELSITIRPNILLDYDTVDERIFKLTVEAVDGGQPPLRGHMLLVIHLTDLNDNVPTFDKSQDSIELMENTIYKEPIYKARATDEDAEDNSLVRYTLNPGSVNMPTSLMRHFQLDSISGELRLTKLLDFETYNQRVIDLSIGAHDAGSPPLSSSMKLTVRVIDVNDNPPQLVVQVNQSIVENSKPNRLVLRWIVRDADEVSLQKIKCEPDPVSIQQGVLRLEKSPDDSLFNLYTKSVVDHEIQPWIYFGITCVDAADPPQMQRFNLTLKVLDVNDNVPIFVSTGSQHHKPMFSYDGPNRYWHGPLYNLTISEAEPVNELILIVRANDADSDDLGRVIYALCDAPKHPLYLQSHRSSSTQADYKEYFKIDQTTGSVFLTKRLDYELSHTIHFGVLAIDNPDALSSERNTATAMIHVNLIDINDNSPELSSPSRIRVVEHVPIGTKLGHVQFTDADSGSGGVVTIKGLLSLNQTNEFRHPRLSEDFNRMDSHDGTKSIDATKYFKLTDDDQVVTIRTIDREEASVFELYILAVDHGIPIQLATTATVTIQVIDINDNSPGLRSPFVDSIVNYQPVLVKLEKMPVYMLNGGVVKAKQSVIEARQIVEQYSHSGTSFELANFVTSQIVQQLEAQDSDDGVSSEVSYELLSKCNGSETFHVDPHTGMIRYRLRYNQSNTMRLVRSVDDIQWTPSPGLYLFCVRLVDHGEPPLSGSGKFWLRVTDPVEKSALQSLWPSDAADALYRPGFISSQNNQTHDNDRLTGSDRLNQLNPIAHASEPQFSNIVFSLLVSIFAVTLICALTAAILWAHSKHRKTHLPSRYANRGTVYTPGSKWVMNDDPIDGPNSHQPDPAITKPDEAKHSSQPVGTVTKCCSPIGWNLTPHNIATDTNVWTSATNTSEVGTPTDPTDRLTLCGFGTLTTVCDLIPPMDRQSNRAAIRDRCQMNTIKQSTRNTDSLDPDQYTLPFVKNSDAQINNEVMQTVSVHCLSYPIVTPVPSQCPTHGPHIVLHSEGGQLPNNDASTPPTLYTVGHMFDATSGVRPHGSIRENTYGFEMTPLNTNHLNRGDMNVDKQMSWIPLITDPLTGGSPSGYICIDPMKTSGNLQTPGEEKQCS